MVKFKPHTITVKLASEPVDPTTKTVKAVSYAAAVSVSCQVTPKDASYAFNRFGIQTDNPHEVFCEVEDADKFSIGARVYFNDEPFYIQTKRIQDVGMPSDHCQLLMAKNQYGVD